MPSLANLFAFALMVLGIAVTPGPNMIYLISRSIFSRAHFTRGVEAGFELLYGVRGVRPYRAHFRRALRL